LTLTIPADDHGQIRVFATDADLPANVIEKTAEGLTSLLGAPLDPTYVDIIRISDLVEMTLTDYIAEGYDMTSDMVDKAVVNAVTGFAILVLSRATGGQAATLAFGAGVHHVTTYSPTARIAPPEKLPDASAQGTFTPVKPPQSNARIGGMVAMYALIFMFALVGLMVWVGG
jgi:hypothetical protein